VYLSMQRSETMTELIKGKLFFKRGERFFISCEDFGTFREATFEETMEYRTMQTEENRKSEEALKKELPFGVKLNIEDIITELNQNVAEYETKIEYLEQIKNMYPYRDYGLSSFKEAVGYLEDTISDLENLIKRKE